MHSIGNSLVTFVRGRSIGCAGAGLGGGLPMLEPLSAVCHSLPWAGTHSDSSRDREPVASCSSRSSLAIQVQVYDESHGHGLFSHVLASWALTRVALCPALTCVLVAALTCVLVGPSVPPSLGQVTVPKYRSVRAGRRSRSGKAQPHAAL
jgi:hypothetical protein